MFIVVFSRGRRKFARGHDAGFLSDRPRLAEVIGAPNPTDGIQPEDDVQVSLGAVKLARCTAAPRLPSLRTSAIRCIWPALGLDCPFSQW